MTLPATLAVLVLLEGLAGAALLGALARARLAADQRHAIEADLAADAALALARVSQGAALAGIPPGTDSLPLPAPALDGWEVHVHAAREGGAAPIRLAAIVVRRNPAGAPVAARTAVLLLRVTAADTAIVLPERERH